ncbi:MAG: ADP-forming succinate--CoA ligase subunit beta [Chloroflexia bacterium]
MKIHEYQARAILARYGLPVVQGDVASTPEEARSIAERLGRAVVLKAQVHVGGRGKAGGIRLAATPAEAEDVARALLGSAIRGIPIRRLLVAEAVEIAHEYYLGVVLDRAARRITVMASAEGGVEIESVAGSRPEAIVRVTADPFLGLRGDQARTLAFSLGLRGEEALSFAPIASALYRAFVDNDATLAEINPLVRTLSGEWRALDSKMILDDSAWMRHPEWEGLRDAEAEDPAEAEARAHGISYVRLDGEIGCMVNGAGLAMATMDTVQLYGGSPANFLDIGGGARAEKVAAALRIILSDPRVKAVLFNIFGGITRCDEVARGILAALEEVRPTVPLVARLVGTNEEEGREILAQAHLMTAETMAEAAQKVVAASRGIGG